MQRIELDDQARREGWGNTPRYWAELGDLADGAETVRSEFGDDAYDRYLFAGGRPNRLWVARPSNPYGSSTCFLLGWRAGNAHLDRKAKRLVV